MMSLKPGKDHLKSIPNKDELCPVCSDLSQQDVKRSSFGHGFCGSSITGNEDTHIDGCQSCIRDKGCTKEGTVGDLDKHEGDCDYDDVVTKSSTPVDIEFPRLSQDALERIYGKRRQRSLIRKKSAEPLRESEEDEEPLTEDELKQTEGYRLLLNCLERIAKQSKD